MKYLLLFLISGQLHAADQWRCTDESTTRTLNVWQACGVGEGSYEAASRESALKNALNEFRMMCQMSTDCKDRKLSIEPKRSSCTVITNGYTFEWKCYKLVQITVE